MMKERIESPDLFKLKRKWQIALRRYVLEQKPSPAYARYFGLPIYLFREWIEMQFDKDTNWDNFGKQWQFDHVIPTSYFDFQNEGDLLLCWNFVNIRVGRIAPVDNNERSIDVLSAKTYFSSIYLKTNYFICEKMIEKIESLEATGLKDEDVLELFISNHQQTLDDLKGFSEEDFERINSGVPVADIVAENLLFAKFAR